MRSRISPTGEAIFPGTQGQRVSDVLPPGESNRILLFAASCDPKWLRAHLNCVKPALLSVDLHSKWIAACPCTLRECLHQAAFISGTGQEFEALLQKNPELDLSQQILMI